MRTTICNPRTGTRFGWWTAALVVLAFPLLLIGCGGGSSGSTVAGDTLPDGTTPPASTTLEAPVITQALPGDTFTVTQWEPVAQAQSYDVIFTDDGSVPTKENGTRVIGATSPFVHGAWFDPEAIVQAPLPGGGLEGGPFCYVVVACNSETESDVSTHVELDLITGQPSDPGEEGFGNNLATPLLFAEGFGLSGLPTGQVTGLREHPDGLDENSKLLATDAIFLDGIPYYLQGTESFWQADWANGIDETDNPEVEAMIKWGDSLLSHQWNTGMKYLRVEAALYQDVPLVAEEDLMNGFDMTSLFGAMYSEYYGTTGTVVPTNFRQVFTPNARLQIDKVTFAGGDPPVTEPPVYEDAYTPANIFDQALFPEDPSDIADGPGSFYAEVTGSGNTTYGLVWPTETVFAYYGAGWYRITFSLNETAYCHTLVVPETVVPQHEDPGGELVDEPVPLNTRLVDPLPLVAEAAAEEGEDEGTTFTPELVHDENYPDDPDMMKSVLFIYISQ